MYDKSSYQRVPGSGLKTREDTSEKCLQSTVYPRRAVHQSAEGK